MSGGLDLEQRYRRVLRLLPGWYRDKWEEDMVATFLDSWLTGDPEDDEWLISSASPPGRRSPAWPAWPPGCTWAARALPRRYFAWGQAVRNAVLAVMLVHAVLGLNVLVRTAWSRRLFGAPRAAREPADRLARRRLAHGVLPGQLRLDRDLRDAGPRALPHCPGPRGAGHRPRPGRFAAGPVHRRLMPAPFGPWAFWVLLNLVPVLAMAAFHRGRPAGHALALAAGPARRLPPGDRAAAGAPGDRQLRLGAGHSRAVLPPGRPRLPGARAPGLVPPGRGLGRVVADPDAARRRRRGVPDRSRSRLPARPAPDRGEPGRTAHPGWPPSRWSPPTPPAPRQPRPRRHRIRARTTDGLSRRTQTCRSSPRRAHRPSWPACWPPRASCSPWPAAAT